MSSTRTDPSEETRWLCKFRKGRHDTHQWLLRETSPLQFQTFFRLNLLNKRCRAQSNNAIDGLKGKETPPVISGDARAAWCISYSGDRAEEKRAHRQKKKHYSLSREAIDSREKEGRRQSTQMLRVERRKDGSEHTSSSQTRFGSLEPSNSAFTFLCTPKKRRKTRKKMVELNSIVFPLCLSLLAPCSMKQRALALAMVLLKTP